MSSTSVDALPRPRSQETLLSRPLYALNLPPDLVQSLKLRSVDIGKEVEERSRSVSPAQVELDRQSGCAVCPDLPTQRSAEEVRSHFRSDWHRYNAGLSKRGQGKLAVSEETFYQLAEEVSSDEESDGEIEKAPLDTVSNLLNRMTIRASDHTTDQSATDEEADISKAQTVAREPHLWFLTRPDGKKVIEQTQFGLLRQLFHKGDLTEGREGDWFVQALKDMQSERIPASAIGGIKRLKGARAADEASKILGAVFLDASGEQAITEEDEAEASECDTSDDNTATSATLSTRLLKGTRTWTIILLGGGDFSAITIALNPYDHIASKRKETLERQFVIVARKQFHRYTTRRKQGGSQSAQDASGRFAKSAGANLRRYGEQQLGQEIRELLDSPKWRESILGSDRIWIRAGLRSARGVLWSWASGGAAHESPLDEMRRRGMVQNLPIATRKPTVGECLRCFAELTRVRIRHETTEEMERRDAAYRAQLEGSRQAREERRKRQMERLQRQAEQQKAEAARSEAKVQRLDPIEHLRRERFVRLVEMIKKGRLNNMIKHLDKYEVEMLGRGEKEPDDVDDSVLLAQRRINAPLPAWWRGLDAKAKRAYVESETEIEGLASKQKLVPTTLLQLAAEGGHEAIVHHLLVERKADPTIPIDAPPSVEDIDATAASAFPHRTAYDLCTTREARDVFRKQVAAEPSRCDWSGTGKGAARVPKALTEEMEEARNKEEIVRDKRQAMRDRARKREEQEALQQAHTITADDRLAADAPLIRAAAKPVSSNAHSNKLGGGNSIPRALQKQRDDEAGLTPEMRARIEREKRARAAEARFKSLQQGGS